MIRFVSQRAVESLVVLLVMSFVVYALIGLTMIATLLYR